MARPLKSAILASAVAVFGGLCLVALGAAYLRPHCLPLDTIPLRRSEQNDEMNFNLNAFSWKAMQLTASKPVVYAWSVCRRERILRGMHRGLAAADLVSR